MNILMLNYEYPLKEESVANRPLLLLAVLLIVLGVQFITMGLLGEIITRTYYEVQDKPIYAVKEIID